MITTPTLIATIPTWPDEEIRVCLDPYRGQAYISIRRWYRVGDSWRPGRAGVSANARHLPALAAAFRVAEEAAREIGVIR
jgi:hypothetical protein